MTTRRDFLRYASYGLALSSIAPAKIFASNKNVTKVTILHTNDMHSHIEPFSSGRNKGLGGMAQLSSLVKKIRQEEDNVLLLDAGDIFQGTPYFNVFEGKLEYQLMSKMGYDAITLGNHDFDNGIIGLTKQMKHADFEFLSANYNFSDTELAGKTSPFKIFNKGGIKIGVLGIGIELKGLVDSKLYGNTEYLDPIKIANKTASKLKNEMHCDLVICLSHLGFKYKSNKISDQVLAQKTNNIDLIIGGHTHTFLKEPLIMSNLSGKKVLINQVGFGAIKLGKIDFTFDNSQILTEFTYNSSSLNNS